MGNLTVDRLDDPNPPEWPGLSRRVLRHVIINHDLPIGSRILDVGCERGDLVHFLHQLGFDVVGINRSREIVDAARDRSPHLDLRHGQPDGSTIAGMHPFDVVIVRDFAGYDDNLFSLRSLETTANLLSCLRPGRVLVFLARTGLTHTDGASVHSTECFQSHLQSFPGSALTTVLPDSYVAANTWTSLLAGRRPTGYLTATMQLPAESISRDEWMGFAATAARVFRPPCCQAKQSSRTAA